MVIRKAFSVNRFVLLGCSWGYFRVLCLDQFLERLALAACDAPRAEPDGLHPRWLLIASGFGPTSRTDADETAGHRLERSESMGQPPLIVWPATVPIWRTRSGHRWFTAPYCFHYQPQLFTVFLDAAISL